MNISQFMDDTVQKVDQIDWKKVTKELIELWVTFFKAMVALVIITYLACKAGMWMINRLNDWLSARWLRMLGLNIPIMEEAENEEDEVPLPAPPSTATESGKIPLIAEAVFTTPQLMLVAAQAPVALLAPALVVQEQQSPAPPRRRRQSAQPAVAVTEATPAPTQRPRGPGAHQERKRARRAGQAA